MSKDDEGIGDFIDSNYQNYEMKFAQMERELSIATSKYNFEVENHSRVSQMLRLSACVTLMMVLLDLIIHGMVIAYSRNAHPISSEEVMALVVSFSFCCGIYANSIALRLRRRLSVARLSKISK
jgi:hypothetical protein